MTVAELIEMLKAYPPDMEVYAGASGGEYPAVPATLGVLPRETIRLGPRGGRYVIERDDVLVFGDDYPAAVVQA